MLDRSTFGRLLLARGAEQRDLFDEARRVRDSHLGPTVVVRGVIEITNRCRVDCDYCPMRVSNIGHLQQYLMDADEIVESARQIRDAGLDVVFLQGGETGATTARVVEAARRIRTELFPEKPVELLLNLGVKRRKDYEQLFDAGCNSYIVKHETADPALALQLRHEALSVRTDALIKLREVGFRTGTGLIQGLPGQSNSSLYDDLALASELGVSMCSVSPLVPAPDTPLSATAPGDIETTLNLIALMRLTQPNWLIPAVSALEKLGGDGGQGRGLDAGANVLTINFTPPDVQNRYQIYGRERFVVRLEHALRTVRERGLSRQPSPFAE